MSINWKSICQLNMTDINLSDFNSTNVTMIDVKANLKIFASNQSVKKQFVRCANKCQMSIYQMSICQYARCQYDRCHIDRCHIVRCQSHLKNVVRLLIDRFLDIGQM